MIRLLSRVLRPYWRLVVVPPDGERFELPKRYRSLGEARVARLMHDLVMGIDGYSYELRRYR